jgi:hypothetical protein
MLFVDVLLSVFQIDRRPTEALRLNAGELGRHLQAFIPHASPPLVQCMLAPVGIEVRFTEMRQHLTPREEKSRPRRFERLGRALAMLSRLHSGEAATPVPLSNADRHAGKDADPADRHIAIRCASYLADYRWSGGESGWPMIPPTCEVRKLSIRWARNGSELRGVVGGCELGAASVRVSHEQECAQEGSHPS